MRIASNHPALAGHFPGHPVVPGVVVMEAVIAALPQHAGEVLRITGIPNLKFLAPLFPEQEFVIKFDTRGPERIVFEVVANGVMLATGTLACDAASPSKVLRNE